ncbi:hypothetical protein [Kribbella sp. NBC_00359]|uniref:hypothetical protein n=1 Tax=Kribbella sp. NBC_00359 TaxID=2975966 RepID=UPI002E20B3FB
MGDVVAQELGEWFGYEQGTADIQLPPDELASWAWCDQEQVEQRMSPLLARRVIAALRARAEGTVFDLENGFHVL